MLKKILIIALFTICIIAIFVLVGIPTLISYRCDQPKTSKIATIDLTNLRQAQFNSETIEHIKNMALSQINDSATYQGIDLGTAVSYLSHGYSHPQEVNLLFAHDITYKYTNDSDYSVMFKQYDPALPYSADCKINDSQCDILLQEQRSSPEAGCLGGRYTGYLHIDMGDGIVLTWQVNQKNDITANFRDFANYLSQEIKYDYCNPNLDKISGQNTTILNVDFIKVKNKYATKELGVKIIGYGNTEDILRLDYYDQNNKHLGGYTFAIPSRTCDPNNAYYFEKEFRELIENQGDYPTQIITIIRQLSKSDVQKINTQGYVLESDIPNFGSIIYKETSTPRDSQNL